MIKLLFSGLRLVSCDACHRRHWRGQLLNHRTHHHQRHVRQRSQIENVGNLLLCNPSRKVKIFCQLGNNCYLELLCIYYFKIIFVLKGIKFKGKTFFVQVYSSFLLQNAILRIFPLQKELFDYLSSLLIRQTNVIVLQFFKGQSNTVLLIISFNLKSPTKFE